MTDRTQTDRTLWAWAALVSLGLAALNLIVPPSFSFEFLYILPMFLCLWSTRPSFAYYLAAVNTCLVLRGMLIAVDAGSGLGIAAANHLLAIAVVWGAAFLCLLRQRGSNAESRRSSAKEHDDLAAARDAAVYTLAKVAESRDLDTGRHLERIGAYSLILARELREDPTLAPVIDEEFLINLRQSSPLHDIGKVAIRDDILRKPGLLTPEEREEMQKHSTLGFLVLQDAIVNYSGAGFLKMAAVIARCHHERFDGQGYPAHLSGRAIPLAARIVAVADVYDALTSERPYKKAYSPEEARDIIQAGSGSHFDPVVIAAFSRRFEDFVAVQRRYPGKHVHISGLVESLLDELSL